MALKRQPLELVQIDFDRCTRTYGTAPCTAALSADTPRKCFNTFATCQDTANYDKGTLTLTFGQNVSGLPKGQTVFPAMAGPVSTSPTKLNTGGVNADTGALGKRERVTLTLRDFPYHDGLTDPYRDERISGAAQNSGTGYDPAAQGTFFGRLRARSPYYVGRPLRVYSGYVGDSLGAMTVKNYVISEWTGPDASGRVEITAKDVLDLADNEKAQCPAPSTGKLGEDIDTGMATFDLTPSGVGSDYPAAGRASLGSEIVTFTRSSDTITLTGRGADGSEIASHSEGDTFQLCYRCAGASIADVLEDLFGTYAGIDAGFLPTTDWDTEVGRWLAGFRLTTTIPKPVGVAKLAGELCELGVSIWWDIEAQEIKLRANRPPDVSETFATVTDDNPIIKGTIQRSDLHDSRLTRVLFYHGVLDFSGSVTDPANYRRLNVPIDADAESENEYGQIRTKEIFCRWLGNAGIDAVATAASTRFLNRFRDTPQEVEFLADIDSGLEVAELVELTSRVIQDDTGAALPTQMQIISSEERDQGNRLRIIMQTFGFAGRYGFITGNGRGDYAASSAAEIEKGTYIVDGSSLVFGDGTGPYLIF